jgi:hypothetical protein
MPTLQCQHCDHDWTYTGEKPEGAYTNCPHCYYKVKITGS